jgi:hypothetical protein
MKGFIAAAAALSLALVASAAGKDEDAVLIRVSVMQEGRAIASPSFLAKVGEPAVIKMGDGLKLEALAKPKNAIGDAWTQIRITYFETPDGHMVQEMTMRHPQGVRTGSFEYTDAAKRRYVVRVGG